MRRKSSYSSPQTQRAQAVGTKAVKSRAAANHLKQMPVRPSQPVKSPMKVPMGKVAAFKMKAQQKRK